MRVSVRGSPVHAAHGLQVAGKYAAEAVRVAAGFSTAKVRVLDLHTHMLAREDWPAFLGADELRDSYGPDRLRMRGDGLHFVRETRRALRV